MRENTCCFLGHRKIFISDELYKNTYKHIKHLIVFEKVDTFLFGSNSQFNDLCYQIVSNLKAGYPHIKRVYIRAQFPYITADYQDYLLRNYEETYYPIRLLDAGKASYILRNMEMIDKSEFCIVYFNKHYSPSANKKSGTSVAYEYAVKRNKKILNLFENV